MINPMLFIGPTSLFSGTDGKSGPLGSATRELRWTNLLGDFLEGEASVFEPLPKTCFVKQKMQYTCSNYDYYAKPLLLYYAKPLLQMGRRSRVGRLVAIFLYSGCYTWQYCTEIIFERIQSEWDKFKRPGIDRKRSW